ncbi:MAG: iron ABC transporter permease [Chloroflexi bacterium]|nr:iron ABC transporter permease [Chloroflexota bacterium]
MRCVVPFYRLLWLLPLAFLAVFFLYPLLTILDVSLRQDGVWQLQGFAALFTQPHFRETLWFTLWQAALSTFLTLLLALPGAYLFARYDFPGKRLLAALAVLPFVLPTVVTAVAFLSLLSVLNNALMSLLGLSQPPLRLEGTLALILLVHVFYNYAVALRIIGGFWANQNARLEEAARVLGCRGWRLWWEIRLPLLRPALWAAALLIFVFTFTSFGVVLILGGRYSTLEVEIYRQAVVFFDLPVAAALALVQIAVMLALMLIYTRLQRRMALDMQSVRSVARRPAHARQWLLVGGNIALMTALLFAPLLALLLRAFTVGGEGFTLYYFLTLGENLRRSPLFVPPAVAIGNSLFFAIITTLLALLLGTLTAYLLASKASRLLRWLDPLFMLPLATSAVTLGFGFIVALDEPPLNLRTSIALIPLAHTLVALPFVVRSVLPALRALPPSLPEAAQVLGAPPFRVWRLIELPLISRALLVGATFAFTVSMGEFGAALLITRPEMPTIPVVIFRLLGQPGTANYGQALALSVLLMLVCAVSFILIERLRDAGTGAF